RGTPRDRAQSAGAGRLLRAAARKCRYRRARWALAAPAAPWGSFGSAGKAANIRFCRRRGAGCNRFHPGMNEAAFGTVTGRLEDAALVETIRRRVEAAGTSFYWAMRLLPHHRRNGMYAVYAFCREVDEIGRASCRESGD